MKSHGLKLAAVALPFLATLAAAQSPAPPAKPQGADEKPPTIASVLDMQLSIVETRIVPAAEAMPEDKYGFAPAAQGDFKTVRTFAEEVKHIANSNTNAFNLLLGEKVDMKEARAHPNGPDNIKTKAEILKFLKDSFALGHKAIATITPENAVTKLPSQGPPFFATRLGIAGFAAWHPMDHYGQMVEYLRMNGVIPPASREGAPGQPAPAK
jgi:hypothetical protein